MILTILEMNYSVSPGGVDMWEVMNDDGYILFSSEDPLEAISYALGSGMDFEVLRYMNEEVLRYMNENVDGVLS